MQITQENIDSLNAILKLSVKKEDYEQKVMSSLQNYRKQVDMKGFRKGHVPMGVMKKMYGNKVLADTINDLLNEKVNSYIVDNKLDILGNPLPKEGQEFDIRIDATKDFDFEYEIGLAPSFELTYLEKKPTIEREVIKVSDEMIKEELDRIQKRYGQVEDVVDALKEDDMLTFTFQEIDSKGNIADEGLTGSAPLALDMIKDKKLSKSILKLKIDETITIDNISKALEKSKEDILKQFFNNSEIDGDIPALKATLTQAKRVVPAEITEDLLKTIYGEDTDAKTEADLKKKIEEEVSAYFAKESDKKVYNQLAEQLIEKTTMQFPDTFLKRWIKLTNENPISDEKLEEEYPAFAKNLKWSLIIKKVSKENDIDVSMDEVKQRLEVQIRQQMASYGIPDMPKEELDKFVANMMAKRDHVSQTRESLLEEKLFDYFSKQIKTKEKKVTLEEFYKQNK